MTPTAGQRPAADAQAAAAVDLARAALDGLAEPGSVGEHLGVEVDGDRLVTHLFACALPGYRGWRWAVTVTRASRARSVTVDETVLLPGPDALLAPEWVPWSERLRPGDLGVGDLLPTRDDDARLEPGWNALEVGADPTRAEEDDAGWEADVVARLDLARSRVLSPIGLDDAVDRWLSGDHGPTSAMSQAAPAACATCGFRVPLTGRLARAFGICANELSPSDGHVVSLDHGCGAHSEAAVLPSGHPPAPPVVDELGFDVVAAPSAGEPAPHEPGPHEPGPHEPGPHEPGPHEPGPHEPGTVRDDDPVEDMGHS